MANRYDVGDLVKVTGTFTDPDNSDAAIDPTAVYCTVTDPSGEETVYQYGVDSEVVKSSTGVYTMNVDVQSTGFWYYRWWSTGTAQAAAKNTIKVI